MARDGAYRVGRAMTDDELARLVERLSALRAKQRIERGDALDYGSPDPELTGALIAIKTLVAGRVTARPAERRDMVTYQKRVDKWMDACFNEEIKADITERSDRFIEEALEFVQAAGYTAARAHALVDYTFNRPQGEVNQEVGGVMVTLAAMCNALGVDIDNAAETELARVWIKIDTIRAKQARKPTGSALP